MTQDQAFIRGFLKAAAAQGFRHGQAWDLLRKVGIDSGSFSLPSFSPNPDQAPSKPLVDSVQPSKMFPMPPQAPKPPTMNGSLGGMPSPSGSLGVPQNFGYNINQTGMGGVNNSVTSAPSTSIGAALNKPIGMPGSLTA